MGYRVYVDALTVHPLIIILLPTIKVDFQQSEMEMFTIIVQIPKIGDLRIWIVEDEVSD